MWTCLKLMACTVNSLTPIDGKPFVRGSYLPIQDYSIQFQEGRIHDYASFVFSFIVPSTVWDIE